MHVRVALAGLLAQPLRMLCMCEFLQDLVSRSLSFNQYRMMQMQDQHCKAATDAWCSAATRRLTGTCSWRSSCVIHNAACVWQEAVFTWVTSSPIRIHEINLVGSATRVATGLGGE